MNPLLLVDSYKVNHQIMYPQGMTLLYSNLTPRKSRLEGINEVVVFGIQYFIKEYLEYRFNKYFFEQPLEFIINQYKEHNDIDTAHIEQLHNLGYLPIEIKGLPEGSLCPIGVPCMTIKNTHVDFGWLTNYLETLLSCVIWQPITSATIAHNYKKILDKYAIETTGSVDFVQWQGHDFSMRGMSSPESAITSGMGHLLSFTGTDTIPAIYAAKKYYNAEGLIGASVPATEHSVMCMGQKESEIDTFKRLLDLYPTGILSVVSDTWDLWKVCTEYLPALKEQILARDGKLVIRPDSGDPVAIICGFNIPTIEAENYEEFLGIAEEMLHEELVEETPHGEYGGDLTLKYYWKGKLYEVTYSPDWNRHDKQYYFIDNYGGNKTKAKELESNPADKGVIELLWDVFGGTVNQQGYKELNSCIGAIYGDSITLERAQQICERLKAKGFASTNIVLGIGSYTYQYNTRDTFGFAMKATYGEINNPCTCTHTMCGKDCNTVEAREIFKDPITDDGTKRSKKGLLKVTYDDNMNIVCADQQNWDQEKTGLLETVFLNGRLTKESSLEEIRNRLKK